MPRRNLQPVYISHTSSLPPDVTICGMRRVALHATFGSAVSILFSIALSQFLLGLALVLLLASRQQRRFPPIRAPLCLFALLTVIAVALSVNPVAGLVQIRKFFVFGIVLAVASTYQTIAQVSWTVAAWGLVAAVSALRGIGQFVHRYREAHQTGSDYYEFYLDSRVTGLASHWMTFGGELMIVLLMLAALLLFAFNTRARVLAAAVLPFLGLALILGLTRGIFLAGVPAGLLYLLWNWKRWSLAFAPLVAVMLFWSAPTHVKERVLSVVQPHGMDDSNDRRVILTRTGLAMIRAHPWFGLGPEQVGPQFIHYVPQDVPRPLPKGWYGHLHNVYLQYAAERGIPALLVMLWLLAKIMVDLHRAARRLGSHPAAWALYGAVAAEVGVLAEGFFEYNLGDSEVLTMFLVAVSCGYVVRWSAEQSLSGTPSLRPILVSSEAICGRMG
jgi:putative inorganic carbon (hco3(-)) transporter